MRNAVVGIVLGVTIVAPRLKQDAPAASGDDAQPAKSDRPPDVTMQMPRRLFAKTLVRFKMASAFTGATPLLVLWFRHMVPIRSRFPLPRQGFGKRGASGAA